MLRLAKWLRATAVERHTVTFYITMSSWVYIYDYRHCCSALISGQFRLFPQSALILPSASLSNRNCKTNGKLQLRSPCETASRPRLSAVQQHVSSLKTTAGFPNFTNAAVWCTAPIKMQSWGGRVPVARPPSNSITCPLIILSPQNKSRVDFLMVQCYM